MIKKLPLCAAVVVILIVTAIVCAACTEQVEGETTAIDWNMHGAWLSADGTVSQTVDAAVNGIIVENEDGNDDLNISFTFSDDFHYLLDKPEPYFMSMNRKYNDLPHLMIAYSFGYNKQLKDSPRCVFALSMEEECFIILYEDAPGYYLVASTDPNADPQALLDYFSDFTESYSFKQ